MVNSACDAIRLGSPDVRTAGPGCCAGQEQALHRNEQVVFEGAPPSILVGIDVRLKLP